MSEAWMPSLADLEQARENIGDVAHRTPLEHSNSLSELIGAPAYLKCENLQRTGSFKIRGAYHRLSRLTEEEKARGVVAASAGNHAQGVAFAARELGIAATIFMPVGVALPKLQATRAYGAQVELRGDTVDEALAAADAFATESGAIMIHPFDHADIITGQGTLGLELYEQCPDVDTVIVPVGGGGLIAGIAAAVRQRARADGRTVRVIGVQSGHAAAYPLSLERGEPTGAAVTPTIADGIAVGKPGRLGFDIVRELVDEMVTVDDDAAATALLMLLERAKLVVEPAGAVGVAAVQSGLVPSPGTTVIVLSGGNIDPLMMERIISHGLAASGRYLKLRVPLPDRPGQLARAAAIVAEANANVVEVLHTRHGAGMQLSQVELELHIETRGRPHSEQVLRRLREAGYEPRVVSPEQS